MSLEFAAKWFGVAAVVFTAAAALTGIFAWYFSSKLSDVREAAFNHFKEESRVAVESAKEKAAEANLRAAEANKIAEGERLARVKLEARIAPRRLTGEQMESLSRFLSDKTEAVTIVSCMDDMDSIDFANDFESAIKAAPWETLRVKNRLSVEYGVSIGSFEGTILASAMKLSEALTGIGVQHSHRVFGESEKGSIPGGLLPGVLYLMVEHKPPASATSADAK